MANSLGDGDLLKTVEENGIELLLTTDRRIQCQQNLKRSDNRHSRPDRNDEMARVRLHFAPIIKAMNAATPGSYAEVKISFG